MPWPHGSSFPTRPFWNSAAIIPAAATDGPRRAILKVDSARAPVVFMVIGVVILSQVARTETHALPCRAGEYRLLT
ncbi:hypothetical protein [Nonomuraea sp. LPB2021202275-12-8]|uniref:hypothetical protein n=1 Tax=Nonomuraea sp. LPB2021202275-12-8 TaxID=3120159 RepID=UPI00300C5D2F